MTRRREKRRATQASNGLSIPDGAILADVAKQAPNNSYAPPLFYVDEPFVCVDCGSEEIWTAEQQKWFYEVAKGPIYAKAIRCRPCRNAEKDRKASSQEPDSD